MLPDIGIIIGLYVITRYCQFIREKNVWVFSLICLILTIIIMGDLITKGTVK